MDEMLGIDLSAWRPDLNTDDFDKLQEKGLSFVFNRLTLGNAYADPTAERYLSEAEDRGLVTGVYHFMKAPGDADPQWDGRRQAEWFVNRIRNLAARGVQPDFYFLDVEEDGITWGQIIHFVEDFRAALGLRIGLYTRETFYEPRFGDKPNIWDYLWFARYTDDKRWLNDWRTPASEESKRPDAEFWQFTDDFKWGSPDGRESVDGNIGHFATMKQMLRLVAPRITVEV